MLKVYLVMACCRRTVTRVLFRFTGSHVHTFALRLLLIAEIRGYVVA
jgi:hypothetical protein